MSKCKVCGSILFTDNILTINNAPKTAQYFSRHKQENDKTTFGVKQCSGCGLVQLDVTPVPYYKNVIRATSVSKEMKQFRNIYFSGIISKFNLNKKRLIEVGCGNGDYLSILNELDIDVSGIEYNYTNLDLCKDKKLKTYWGYIDKPDYVIDSGLFDGFLILNFLEHCPEPNIMLKGIYNNLTNDGIGVIEVPNFDMMLKEGIYSEFMIDHLMYFTKDSLTTMLNINGFEILEINEICNNYILSAIIKKRKPINTIKFSNKLQQLSDEINKFIDFHKNTVIYGAGHQSLYILSTMSLENKIKFVVDDIYFKQNKYTPGSNIPVISFDKLKTLDIDSVIVIGGSYSNEMANKIREWNSNIKIKII